MPVLGNGRELESTWVRTALSPASAERVHGTVDQGRTLAIVYCAIGVGEGTSGLSADPQSGVWARFSGASSVGHSAALVPPRIYR
jgi:hypothetical protein